MSRFRLKNYDLISMYDYFKIVKFSSFITSIYNTVQESQRDSLMKSAGH